MDVNNLEEYFEEDNMYTFKMKLADALIDKICPIGEKYHALLKEEGYILETLEKGAKQANAQAEKTIGNIRKGLGLLKTHIQ